MPGGVVFLVCIPTLSYEHELVFGVPLKRSKRIEKSKNRIGAQKVDLRLREARTHAQLLTLDDDGHGGDDDDDDDVGVDARKRPRGRLARAKTPTFVSMETVTVADIKRYKSHNMKTQKDDQKEIK